MNLLALIYGKKSDKVVRINPYGKRDYKKDYDITRLYAVLERRPFDHKLHYLFFIVKHKNYNKTIKNFVDGNPKWFGSNPVVIELGETYSTDVQVRGKAAILKKDAATSEVYVPAIILGQKT